MLEVYTSNIKIKDKDALDITVKSGDKTFAPTWKMVMGYKNGKISKKEYSKRYRKMMRKSYIENNLRWKEILSMDRIVFQCYCKANKFCHRLLLAGYFNKIDDVVYKGEITE